MAPGCSLKRCERGIQHAPETRYCHRFAAAHMRLPVCASQERHRAQAKRQALVNCRDVHGSTALHMSGELSCLSTHYWQLVDNTTG